MATTFGRPPAKAQTSGLRILDLKGLREKGIFYSSNYLREMWNRGDFPAPFKPTPRKLAWREDVIDAWIASKEAA